MALQHFLSQKLGHKKINCHLLILLLLFLVSINPFTNYTDNLATSFIASDLIIYSKSFRNETNYGITVDPLGLHVDSGGDVFIADYQGGKIRKIDSSTGFIRSVAGCQPGYDPYCYQVLYLDQYIPDEKQFYNQLRPDEAVIPNPRQFASDSNETLYMTVGNQIMMVTSDWKHIYPLVGTGNVASDDYDGYLQYGLPGMLLNIDSPYALALHYNETSKDKMLYFSEKSNVILRMNLSSLDLTVQLFAGDSTSGTFDENIPATQAKLGYSMGLAADSSGTLFYSDTNFHRIRKIETNGSVVTVIGNGFAGSISFEGVVASISSNSSRVNYPTGLLLDEANSIIYYCDTNNFVLRKIRFSNPFFKGTGYVYTVAGTDGVSGFSGDGSLATLAVFSNKLTSVARDHSGSFYLSDNGNKKLRIASVTPTSRPSMQPSRQPSSQPSNQPATRPSAQPSSSPSTVPSALPTSNPTPVLIAPKDNTVVITISSFALFFIILKYATSFNSDIDSRLTKGGHKYGKITEMEKVTKLIKLMVRVDKKNNPIISKITESSFFPMCFSIIDKMFTRYDITDRFVAELKRHHKWLLLFYPHKNERKDDEEDKAPSHDQLKNDIEIDYTSARIASLFINLLMVMTILSIIFDDDDFNPYIDGKCEEVKNRADCLQIQIPYGDIDIWNKNSRCYWQGDTNPGVCHARFITASVNLCYLVAFVAYLICQPFSILVNWLLMDIVMAPPAERYVFKGVDKGANWMAAVSKMVLFEKEKVDALRENLANLDVTCSKLVNEIALFRASMASKFASMIFNHNKLEFDVPLFITDYFNQEPITFRLTWLEPFLNEDPTRKASRLLDDFDRFWGINAVKAGDGAKGSPTLADSVGGVNEDIPKCYFKKSTHADLKRHIEEMFHEKAKEEIIMETFLEFERGKRLTFLFQKDMLSYWPSELLRIRFEFENRRYTRQIKKTRTFRQKFYAVVFLSCLIVVLLNYLYIHFSLFTFQQQNAWLKSTLLYFFADIVFVSTFEVLLFKVMIPSFFDKHFLKAQVTLYTYFISRLDDFNLSLSNKVNQTETDETNATESPLNLFPYLFFSYQLALKYPDLIESKVIRAFKSCEVFNIKCFAKRPKSIISFFIDSFMSIMSVFESLLLNIHSNWYNELTRSIASIFWAGILPAYVFISMSLHAILAVLVVLLTMGMLFFRTFSATSREVSELEHVRNSALKKIKVMYDLLNSVKSIKYIAKEREYKAKKGASSSRQNTLKRVQKVMNGLKLARKDFKKGALSKKSGSLSGSLLSIELETDFSDSDPNDESESSDTSDSSDEENNSVDDDDDDGDEDEDGDVSDADDDQNFLNKFKVDNGSVKVPYSGKFQKNKLLTKVTAYNKFLAAANSNKQKEVIWPGELNNDDLSNGAYMPNYIKSSILSTFNPKENFLMRHEGNRTGNIMRRTVYNNYDPYKGNDSISPAESKNFLKILNKNKNNIANNNNNNNNNATATNASVKMTIRSGAQSKHANSNVVAAALHRMKQSNVPINKTTKAEKSGSMPPPVAATSFAVYSLSDSDGGGLSTTASRRGLASSSKSNNSNTNSNVSGASKKSVNAKNVVRTTPTFTRPKAFNDPNKSTGSSINGNISASLLIPSEF